MENSSPSPKTFDRRQFYTNDDSGKMYVFALLLPYIISFFMAYIVPLISDSQIVQLAFLQIVAPISFIIVYVGYTKFMKIDFKASTIKNKPKVWDGIICVIVALVFVFGPYLFLNLHDAFVFGVLAYPSSGEIAIPGIGELILYIIILAVLPAVAEELLFRGAILQGFRKNFSDKAAILLSALLFALMHGSLVQFVNPFFFGIVLGWIALRTGSVYMSIIIHLINNLITVVLEYVRQHTGFTMGVIINEWWYYVLAIALVGITVLILLVLDKFYFKKRNNHEVEKDRIKSPSIFVWVAIVTGIVMLVANVLVAYLSPAPAAVI